MIFGQNAPVPSKFRVPASRAETALRRLVEGRADRWAFERLASLVTRPASLDDTARQEIALAFAALYQPEREGDVPAPPVRATIIEQFQRLYYHASENTWRTTKYRGVSIQKCPLDLWVYQEMLHDLRPALIVETGTAYGGSAYFLADLCHTLQTGEVVSVDIEARSDLPAHDRISYLTGSSIAPEVVAQVADRLPEEGAVVVILDSDHSRDHVLAELEAYAPMVTQGSYLVVEDTNVGGHPAFPGFGPGPAEAIEIFLADRSDFVVDRSCERLMMTFNPSGYLQRVSGS